ncbi:Chromate transport protein (fragment) [Cupriavidus taiwanensis]
MPGATLIGVAFVLPSFLMVLALGWTYVRFGGLTWMQSVFYGVGAAVIGIIAISAYKLTTKSVAKDKLLRAIYLVRAAVTIVTESEIAWLFPAAGVLAHDRARFAIWSLGAKWGVATPDLSRRIPSPPAPRRGERCRLP